MAQEETDAELLKLIAEAQQRVSSPLQLARGCYTLGREQTLASLDGMLGARIRNEKAQATFASLELIGKWCTFDPTQQRRYMCGRRGFEWTVVLYTERTKHRFFGVDQTDALAQCASWCQGEI